MDAENLVAPIKDLLAGQEFADDMVRLKIALASWISRAR